MNNKNNISKKELLQITGISYGQLYRWKRENLIPESWFIKQSSFTGQETFFPRDKIIKRIDTIQKLKDTHSLEELARLLSPELIDRMFQMDDVHKMAELDIEIVTIFKSALSRDTFTYIEIIFIYALSILKKEKNISSDDILKMVQCFKNWFSQIRGTAYNLHIFKKDSCYYTVIHQIQSQMLIDSRFEAIREFHIDELSNDLKIKYDRRII